MGKTEIIETITNHYLNKSDFNWLPISKFKEYYSDDFKNTLIELIKDRKIDIIFWDNHPNPFIKAFPEDNIEEQIKKIDTFDFNPDNNENITTIWENVKFNFEVVSCCLYPSKQHLKSIVNLNEFTNKPYTLQLALWEAELDFASFEMRILEEYRNDPRYYYRNGNISGSIYCKDENNSLKESDKIFLETFWFSFNKDNLHRHVAVFNIYLSKLSPEHQTLWKSKEVDGSYFDWWNYFMHPVYSENTCWRYTDDVVIFDAIVDEMFHINEMTKLINWQKLFRNDFKDEELRPKEFSYLIRPTKKEYYAFIHCLDKLLSDNFNKTFFEKEKLDLKNEQWENKWTITLLKDYFSERDFEDEEPVNKIFTNLKKIRKLRQKPWHSIIEDEFDYKYLDEQKEILDDTYYIVRFIRLILTNHPNVKWYKVPKYLYEWNKIINY